MPPKDRDASVDALRKAERKKEKAKNKRDRARTREEALAVRDPAPIRAQLARLLPQLAAGALDGAGKKQVELLQKQLRVCLEKRKEAETAQQARQVSARAVTLEGFGEAFGGGADDDDDDDDDGGGGGGGNDGSEAPTTSAGGPERSSKGHLSECPSSHAASEGCTRPVRRVVASHTATARGAAYTASSRSRHNTRRPRRDSSAAAKAPTGPQPTTITSASSSAEATNSAAGASEPTSDAEGPAPAPPPSAEPSANLRRVRAILRIFCAGVLCC